MFGLFGAPCEVNIELEGSGGRKQITYAKDNKQLTVPLYVGTEDIVGSVSLSSYKNKPVDLEHAGVKVELIGQIELFYDRGSTFKFVSVEKELEAAGRLQGPKEWAFDFRDVEKQYDAYNGVNCRLRYIVRVTVLVRKSLTNVVAEQELWVHNYAPEPEHNQAIRMEVGIEDALHIEFEFNKTKYHMKDVIIGKIYFILVRIKIRMMELSLLKRETTGSGSGANSYSESETLIKYEIMDGAPVKGESVPVRLFLNSCAEHLTPTYKSVHTKFSCRYYCNLVLIDEEERRYFKQSEIILYRREPKKKAKKNQSE